MGRCKATLLFCLLDLAMLAHYLLCGVPSLGLPASRHRSDDVLYILLVVPYHATDELVLYVGFKFLDLDLTTRQCGIVPLVSKGVSNHMLPPYLHTTQPTRYYTQYSYNNNRGAQFFLLSPLEWGPSSWEE